MLYYYRVRAEADIEYSMPDQKTKEKRIRSKFNFNWDDISGRTELQTDRNKDGMSFTSPQGQLKLPNFTPVHPESDTQQFYTKCRLMSMTLMLCNTDIHYYKYHKSMQQRI